MLVLFSAGELKKIINYFFKKNVYTLLLIFLDNFQKLQSKVLGRGDIPTLVVGLLKYIIPKERHTCVS